MSGLSRRVVDKQYRPNGFGLSPGLQRARAPYRLRNALTGVLIGSFAVGVWWYSIRAVKQDSFEDVDDEARALLSARLGDEKAQTPSAGASATTAPAAAAAASPSTTPPGSSSAPIIVAQAQPRPTAPETTTTTSPSPPSSPSSAAAQATKAGDADARGVLARWLQARNPRALHPGTKTALVWGAPPVDRVGRLGDTSTGSSTSGSEKRT